MLRLQLTWRYFEAELLLLPQLHFVCVHAHELLVEFMLVYDCAPRPLRRLPRVLQIIELVELRRLATVLRMVTV